MKNIFYGRDVVLVGCGETLNFYEPLKDTVHVGVNHAFLKKDIGLDYLIVSDYNTSIINSIEKIQAKKFIGKTILYPKICHDDDTIAEVGGSPYFIYDSSFLPNLARFDIFKEPFPDYHSVIFTALQIVLLGNPKKIYLAGCDCIPNHFDTDDGGKFLVHSTFVKSWKIFRNMLQQNNPDLPVISINPIGLKGVFIDLYQNKAAVDASYFDAMGGSENEALAAARAAACAAPENLGVAALLCRLLQKKGCLFEAKEYLLAHLKKAPSWANGVRLLASILMEQGQLFKAVEITNQGTKDAPDDLELRCFFVSLLKKIGRKHEADSAIKFGPKGFSSYYGYRLFWRAITKLEKDEDVVECIKQMRIAFSYYKNPCAGEQCLFYFQILLKNNMIEEAERFIKYGLELNPSWEEGYFQRSFLEQRNGQLEKAIESVSKAIYLAPLAIAYRARLAGLLRELGHLDQALAIVDEVLQISPQWADGFFLRSTIWEKSGDLENAFTDAETACANDPSITWLWKWFCELSLRQGKIDTAEKAAQIGVQLNANEGWAYYALFKIHEHTGEINNVIFYIKMAIEKSPEILIYREYLASCLQEQGKLDEAETITREAIQRDPKLGWAWRRLSWIYRDRGDFQNAIKMAKRAVLEDPADISLIENLEQLKTMRKSMSSRTSIYRFLRGVSKKSGAAHPPGCGNPAQE